MRRIVCFVFILFCCFGFSQEMRIGVLRTIKVQSLTVENHQGKYTIYGDSTIVGELSSAKFNIHQNGVKVSLENGTSFVFTKIKIIQNSYNSALSVKSTLPASKTHHYRNNLEISKNANQLTVVNLVDMNNYLAGVIESEGGGGRHIEYYKVQAIMSRTYAMKNKLRHTKEGFHLCDGVHCQAYHNMLRHTPTIMDAVKATTGEVLVDNKNELVASYFSANCGGQTCDASYVWNTTIPYLESFMDTFCIHTHQSTWAKTVDKTSWSKYLEEEFGISEKVFGELIYNFEQNERKAFYIHPSLGIPLRDLRMKFNLKSTYFSTRLEGNSVVIEGRGFGHGVGLCQEGAMQMAKSGFSYKQIAYFYFSNIRILDYYKNQFFRQTNSFNTSKPEVGKKQ